MMRATWNLLNLFCKFHFLKCELVKWKEKVAVSEENPYTCSRKLLIFLLRTTAVAVNAAII